MPTGEELPDRDWLQAELADTLDEDIELELEDAALSREIARIYKAKHPDTIDRVTYLHALIRLQAELINLQDWVQYHKEKVVILFEGRDSAGKGGVIKRITQRLNPRVCAPWRFPRRPTARRPSGTSSATCRICPPAARSCSSTAPGTTALASNA